MVKKQGVDFIYEKFDKNTIFYLSVKFLKK